MEERVPAGFWERAVALCIDAAVVSFGFGFVLRVATVGASVAGFDASFRGRWSVALEGVALISGLSWGYWQHKALGRYLLGIEVVDAASGGPLRLWQAATKAIAGVASIAVFTAALIAFFFAGAPDGPGLKFVWWQWGPLLAALVFGAAWLPMRFSRRRRSLWDLAARTTVVRRPKPVPAPTPPKATPPPTDR